jgi:uncharacterized membrane protein
MILLYSTILLRPYVFFFFMIFIWAAVLFFGWRRTLIFTGIAWVTAFIAEFSSTRTGIPFGYYVYLESTREQELWISNIPFFDSFSFTFLAYASYMMALFFLLPNEKCAGITRILDHARIRSSGSTLLLSTLFFALIDVVIDPLAVRGDRWFLGKIFYYPEPGIYFGVPLSNFLGWAVVGFVTIFCFQRVEQWVGKHWTDKPAADVTTHILTGILLYYLILAFNLAMTFAIGEILLGLIGILIYLPITVFILVRLTGSFNGLLRQV